MKKYESKNESSCKDKLRPFLLHYYSIFIAKRNHAKKKKMQALKKDALEEKVYSKVVLKKVLIISKECLKQKYLLKRWAIARSKGSKVPH